MEKLEKINFSHDDFKIGTMVKRIGGQTIECCKISCEHNLDNMCYCESVHICTVDDMPVCVSYIGL